jgi:hypothetical protein
MNMDQMVAAQKQMKDSGILSDKYFENQEKQMNDSVNGLTNEATGEIYGKIKDSLMGSDDYKDIAKNFNDSVHSRELSVFTDSVTTRIQHQVTLMKELRGK